MNEFTDGDAARLAELIRHFYDSYPEAEKPSVLTIADFLADLDDSTDDPRYAPTVTECTNAVALHG